MDFALNDDFYKIYTIQTVTCLDYEKKGGGTPTRSCPCDEAYVYFCCMIEVRNSPILGEPLVSERHCGSGGGPIQVRG